MSDCLLSRWSRNECSSYIKTTPNQTCLLPRKVIKSPCLWFKALISYPSYEDKGFEIVFTSISHCVSLFFEFMQVVYTGEPFIKLTLKLDIVSSWFSVKEAYSFKQVADFFAVHQHSFIHLMLVLGVDWPNETLFSSSRKWPPTSPLLSTLEGNVIEEVYE